MSKHSFAPKLDYDDYLTLTGFSQNAWTEAKWLLMLPLVNRGLLVPSAHRSYGHWNQSEFRLSRRGKLMAQRYEKDRSAREWTSVHQRVDE